MIKSIAKKQPLLVELAVLCIIVLAAAVACFPLFKYGAPNGHSISFNLAWLSNFSDQLLHGDIYPRWLTNMNSGAGSPVFFFYAPLPFYISSLGVLLFHGSALDVQLAAGEWLLIALSGLSFYVYSRQRFNAAAAMLGAVLYMLLPYHFEIDLWRRQDIGELANYIWMPAILYFVDKTVVGKRGWTGLAAVYAFLIFSHLPTALLFSPFIIIYAALQSNRLPNHSDRKLFYCRIAAGLAVGIVLAGVYLIPALFTQKYISTDKLWNAHLDYKMWFLPVEGANKSPFTERLLTILLDTSAVFIACALNALRIHKQRGVQELLPALIFFALSWFLMSTGSHWLWQIAPILWKVQFPWRVSMVLDLATTMIAVYTLHHLTQTRDSISYVVVGSSCLLLIYCSFTGRYVIGNLDPLEDTHYIAYRNEEVKLGHDAPEYTTVWAQAAFGGDLRKITLTDKVRIDNSIDQVRVLDWEPRKILLDVQARGAGEITIHQFYFPGWRAQVVDDGRVLPMHPGRNFGFAKVNAPAGSYLLLIEMRPMWQEIAGGILSLVGLTVVVMGIRNRGRWHRARSVDQKIGAAS